MNPDTDHPHAALDLRAMDELVAEKVFGMMVWEGVTGTSAAVPPRDKHLWTDLPRYSSTWDAAGQVVALFERVEIYHQPHYRGWVAILGRGEQWGRGDAATFPEACSLAALAALGVDVEAAISATTATSAPDPSSAPPNPEHAP